MEIFSQSSSIILVSVASNVKSAEYWISPSYRKIQKFLVWRLNKLIGSATMQTYHNEPLIQDRKVFVVSKKSYLWNFICVHSSTRKTLKIINHFLESFCTLKCIALFSLLAKKNGLDQFSNNNKSKLILHLYCWLQKIVWKCFQITLQIHEWNLLQVIQLNSVLFINILLWHT